MIARLLIANRGEIACRILRTARRMGIATVAVYSDADADALHVRLADEAVRIGPSPAADSYLNGAAILNVAHQTGADAVHPGYGFLSENAAFAQQCHEAGLVFVGPPVAAIRAMADKSHAKALMRQAGVPVVPGYDGDDQSLERLAREAESIGFPLLVKAAAGGGGRGMRVVRQPDELAAAVDSARREAANAFGDDKLLLERRVDNARHIEVQVFGDRHGNVIHLGERDCSTQRRHQKILEEAPSPFVDEAMRAQLGEAAVAAARAVDYVGAGTVEFIVGEDRAAYFLEMNTRLQVEHPVTEMVTGLDLVEWQLRVAAGEALPLRQNEIVFSGHAIEARLCAEDAAAGFAPQTGKVVYWRPDVAGIDGARVDHGLVEGAEISPFYDPMVAKLIVHGTTRADAIARLERLLLRTPLLGTVTNREFLLQLLRSETFRSGAMTTSHVDGLTVEATTAQPRDFASAAAVLALADGQDWFSTTGVARCPVVLESGGVTQNCLVLFERSRLARVDVGEERFAVERLDIERPVFARDGRVSWLERDGCVFRFEEPDPLASRQDVAGDGVLRAPVSGLLRSLSAQVGAKVTRGDTLAIIEAMKMETALVAPCDGVVDSVRGRLGEQVRAGDIVFELNPDVDP